MIGTLHSLSKSKLTVFALRWLGCDRRWDDRQRCPGAKGHPQLVRHAKHDEDVIEDGNHNGPSSDAEHTGKEAGQAAGRKQYQRQKDQVAHDAPARLAWRTPVRRQQASSRSSTL
jgi:hypothetical protein